MDKRLKLLQDILSVDSTNDNEESVADVIKNYLADSGIDSKKITYAPKRANLVAEIGTTGKSVLGISGHMDVVSAGDPNLWDSPPFAPTERDGKIYARGASDMKSGLAALVMAMIELKEENIPLNGKVKLLATVGEEIGLLGAKQLTDEKYADDLDALIIGEPTGHRIVYAHKGIFTYKITSVGKSAHSSMPELGINAIDNLILFYNRISAEFSKLNDENEALGPFIVNNSIISGGEQVNSVPDSASLIANLRTTPEVNNEKITNILHAVVEELNNTVKGMNLKLEITLSIDPVFSQKNSRLVQIAKEEADTMFKENVPLLGMPGGADSAEFIRANKDMQIIIFGPGNETLHQVNEYVDITNYTEMIDLYKKIIVNYLA